MENEKPIGIEPIEPKPKKKRVLTQREIEERFKAFEKQCEDIEIIGQDVCPYTGNIVTRAFVSKKKREEKLMQLALGTFKPKPRPKPKPLPKPGDPVINPEGGKI
jgi:hypothetical protein